MCPSKRASAKAMVRVVGGGTPEQPGGECSQPLELCALLLIVVEELQQLRVLRGKEPEVGPASRRVAQLMQFGAGTAHVFECIDDALGQSLLGDGAPRHAKYPLLWRGALAATAAHPPGEALVLLGREQPTGGNHALCRGGLQAALRVGAYQQPPLGGHVTQTQAQDFAAAQAAPVRQDQQQTGHLVDFGHVVPQRQRRLQILECGLVLAQGHRLCVDAEQLGIDRQCRLPVLQHFRAAGVAQQRLQGPTRLLACLHGSAALLRQCRPYVLQRVFAVEDRFDVVTCPGNEGQQHVAQPRQARSRHGGLASQLLLQPRHGHARGRRCDQRGVRKGCVALRRRRLGLQRRPRATQPRVFRRQRVGHFLVLCCTREVGVDGHSGLGFGVGWRGLGSVGLHQAAPRARVQVVVVQGVAGHAQYDRARPPVPPGARSVDDRVQPRGQIGLLQPPRSQQ